MSKATSEYYRSYYERNKDKIKKRSLERYNRLQEEINSARREKYKEDPELIRERVRAWQVNNPERRKQSRVLYNQKNPTRVRDWKRKNPERVKAHLAKRYALTRGASDAELFTREEIFERDKGICQYRSKQCPADDWHLDHIFPVSLVGRHARDNVCVSCPSCNISKHNKILTGVGN